MSEIVIIGAGMAGLGAALNLKKNSTNFLLFEKEKRPGGLCRTEYVNGYYFDYTGHLLHFRNELFKSMVFSHIGDNICERKRNAWIYSKGVYTKYPFQANLHGLPEDVVVECIYEYGKRHFREYPGSIVNFRDWIDAHFGSGIARHFMIPYNTKLYCRDPSQLSPDCAGRFVPKSDFRLLLKGIINGGDENLGYNSQFYYPLNGGIETLVKALGNEISINADEKVLNIMIKDKKIITSKGREFAYKKIISTQPVDELINSCVGLMDNIRKYAEQLKYVSVLNVNIGVSGNIGDRHWIYIPEHNYLFHRIGFPHNFSNNMVPSGHSSIYLEISYDPVNGINTDYVVKKSIDDLITMGVIKSVEQIRTVNTIDIPYAYVIFDQNRKKVLNQIKMFLEREEIYVAGRFGSWDYFSMEDAFMDGWSVVDRWN